MKKDFFWLSILVVVTFVIASCGGLRYSQVTKDAGKFHPKSIGVLDIRVGGYPEARDSADEIITGILVEKKWFSSVVSAKKLRERMTSEEGVRDAVDEYLMKLEKVSYSDPELSRKIGEIYTIDAFLVVTVDFWTHTTEGKDKVAKVGFSMDLVEAESGSIIWKAGHHEVKKYKIFKPDISKLARGVSKKLIAHMPH